MKNFDKSATSKLECLKAQPHKSNGSCEFLYQHLVYREKHCEDKKNC